MLRLALCAFAVAVAMMGGIAQAGTERYDYDALGRLVRVIDEQGRVTEYVYDPAGNILQVITSGAGTAQPPAVTAFSPSSLRRGETTAFQITGTGLTGARLSKSDPALDISGLNVSATQISFSMFAGSSAALGTQSISIANAAGTASIQFTVNPVLPKLGMSPLPIAVPPTGGGRSFFVALSSPDNIPHDVTLASANPAIATVAPASVTFAPGEIEKAVTVAGQSAGTTAINLSSATLGATAVPVFVTAEFTGITTSFARALGVVVEQGSGGTSTTFGPFASPLLGIVKGAYIEGIAPSRFAVGSGPSAMVISGNELGGVTGVAVSPATGITLGAITVAPGGRSVSVPVTVGPDAPTTLRAVTLAGAQQPYFAARPGADQILVTLPAPEILSIDPIFATTGTTSATFTVRGRNLQAAEAITFAPGNGISVGATPSVSADGTVLTVAFSVAPLAPTGTHAVTVTTPGGTSDLAPTAANTFNVVNEVQAVVTPVASSLLGVVKEDSAPPAEVQSAFATHVGVVVPPAATGISPAVGVIGESLTLTVSGFGLGGVTAVQFSPSDGLTLGALAVGPDGTSVSVPLTISAIAPQSLREVRLFAGASQVLFTNANAALFRVSAPLPEFDSISPIVLQVGAPTVTLTITGRNFQNATQVRVEPATDITVSPPTVNGGGTQASLTISATAGAATGSRAVVLVSPAGESSSAPSAANTLTLVNTIQESVTPITAPALGVLVESNAPPDTQAVGPISAPAVGIVLEDPNPPAVPSETVGGLSLGVVTGAYASGVQAPPLTPNSSATLVISGVALNDVTAVQIESPNAISVGTLTIAPDGTQISVPITLSGAAAGPRGVRMLRDAVLVPFVPAGANAFSIGVGTPSIDSITPILESRGQTFTMILRGQNFQGVTAVTSTPGTGIQIDNTPSVNGAGTEVSVRVSIADDAPLGSHVFRVHTPGGATTDASVPANAFSVQP